MTTQWVDFKKVKGAVNMQMVLDHCAIKGLDKSGDELRGACPIHKGSARSKNFTVNMRKNAFKCFSRDCGATGNVLDFVAAMERCSVREAALRRKEWFKVGERESELAKPHEIKNQPVEVPRGIYRDKEGALYELVAAATSAEDFERWLCIESCLVSISSGLLRQKHSLRSRTQKRNLTSVWSRSSHFSQPKNSPRIRKEAIVSMTSFSFCYRTN